MLNDNNIGGILGSKVTTFKELCMSKFYIRVSPSVAMREVFAFHPDSMSGNKHNVAPFMMNVLTLRFKQLRSNMIVSVTALEFSE